MLERCQDYETLHDPDVEGPASTFFDNYDRVPDIVETLELDIEFDDEGKMIYIDKSQLFHIIHLMSDSYFKSLLSARYGVAEMEGII